LETEGELTVSEGGTNDVTVLRLRPAAQVEVRVLDEETGKGIGNVDFWSGTSFASRQPHYTTSYEAETNIVRRTPPRTNENGVIHALFEPGKHQVGVMLVGSFGGYRPVQDQGVQVDCEAGKKLTVTFHLRRPTRN
jgi:hypothetical protein